MRELALHVLDILQNTVEAGASRVSLAILEDQRHDVLHICVQDNGRGMSTEQLARAVDPFYTSRTTRHVGLGLPLFRAAAERTDGWMKLESTVGVGTTVEATFGLNHPDRQPLGDMADTLLAFLLSDSAPDLEYSHRVETPNPRDDGVFEFDTAAMRRELDGVPFSHPAVQEWLAEFLREGEVLSVNQSVGDSSVVAEL